MAAPKPPRRFVRQMTTAKRKKKSDCENKATRESGLDLLQVGAQCDKCARRLQIEKCLCFGQICQQFRSKFAGRSQELAVLLFRAARGPSRERRCRFLLCRAPRQPRTQGATAVERRRSRRAREGEGGEAPPSPAAAAEARTMRAPRAVAAATGPQQKLIFALLRRRQRRPCRSVAAPNAPPVGAQCQSQLAVGGTKKARATPVRPPRDVFVCASAICQFALVCAFSLSLCCCALLVDLF